MHLIILALAFVAILAALCITHTVVSSYQTSAGSLSGSIPVTGDTEANSDLVLAPGASNVELDIAFTRTAMKSCGLYCTGDCTIKTNSSGSPSETITLTAGQPITAATLAACEAIFSANITKFFLSSTAGGTFSVRVLLHYGP